jgi:2-polyprenyl-3-methyl-5-hydroxy-6-metoxy-1,4-benzoquinol methylase
MQELVGSSKTVLDVGCWDGLVSRTLLDRGCRVIGLDNSVRAVALAESNGLDARFAELDRPWPVEKNSVDAVLAGEIIEHVLDVDTFVMEAYRVLKPHGYFIVSTPNLAAFGRRLLLLFGLNPHIEISFSGGAAGHVRYFTAATLVGFIESKGFRLLKLTSDVVNFNSTGTLRSAILARTFPTLGRSLISCFEK